MAKAISERAQYFITDPIKFAEWSRVNSFFKRNREAEYWSFINDASLYRQWVDEFVGNTNPKIWMNAHPESFNDAKARGFYKAIVEPWTTFTNEADFSAWLSMYVQPISKQNWKAIHPRSLTTARRKGFLDGVCGRLGLDKPWKLIRSPAKFAAWVQEKVTPTSKADWASKHRESLLWAIDKSFFDEVCDLLLIELEPTPPWYKFNSVRQFSFWVHLNVDPEDGRHWKGKHKESYDLALARGVLEGICDELSIQNNR